MKEQATRRESLGWLGAAGLSALGCGRTSTLDVVGVDHPNGAAGADAANGEGGVPSAAGAGSATPGEAGAGVGPAAGAAGNAASAGAGGDANGGAPGECAAKAETTVGPFPNLSPLDRRDVRGNTSGLTTAKPGANLTLRVRVLDLDASCAPLSGAVVDIWQCDALGLYAGYSPFSTVGQDFCRGYQSTDAQGVAEFLTIFPGSYAGRAIHIHFSVRGAAGTLDPNLHGQAYPGVFVAQLYFEAAVAAEIFAAFPVYQEGAPITANESDGLFGFGGWDLIVNVSKTGANYLGEVTIGVRRSEIGL